MQNEVLKPTTKFGSQIKFTPYAWSKLLYMRDKGPTEVAGYGVTGTDDPLLITDFVLIKQECTVVTFDLDADDSTEYMETMMDKGLMPWQYSNILIHTHPGNSPSPSSTDEDNFKAAFAHPNWAIMFIIAEGGKCYCRLKINVGPGSIRELTVAVDWSQEFDGTNKANWGKEYTNKVQEIVQSFKMTGKEGTVGVNASSFLGHQLPDENDPIWYNAKEDRWARVSELTDEELSPNRQIETEEDDNVDDFDCYWDSNGEVIYWSEYTNSWYSYDPIKEQWFGEDPKDENQMVEIAPPGEKWADLVTEWACDHAEERLQALED